MFVVPVILTGSATELEILDVQIPIAFWLCEFGQVMLTALGKLHNGLSFLIWKMETIISPLHSYSEDFILKDMTYKILSMLSHWCLNIRKAFFSPKYYLLQDWMAFNKKFLWSLSEGMHCKKKFGKNTYVLMTSVSVSYLKGSSAMIALKKKQTNLTEL